MSLKSIFANAIPGAEISYSTFSSARIEVNEGDVVEECSLIDITEGRNKAYRLKGKRYIVFQIDGSHVGWIFPDGSVIFSSSWPSSVDYFDAFIFPNGDILLDADESDDGNVSIDGAAGISFSCLESFFPTPRRRTFPVHLRAILKESKVIDFTNQEWSKSPKPGFTKMGNQYHRAGSTVLRIQGKDYLFGFDDGQYFGCELPRKVKDIDDAFLSLTPKAAIGKKDVKRQGEWFFVPLPKGFRPPEISESVITPSDNDEIALPIETRQSNRHNIYKANIDSVRIIWTPTGMRYFVKDVSISHEQHPNVSIGSNWHEIHKNLAVRSVSQDGVD